MSTTSHADIQEIPHPPILQIRQAVSGLSKSILWRKYLYWKDTLHLPRQCNTIETGCGIGKFSILLGLLGEKTTLLDHAPAVLADAKAAHKHFNLTPRLINNDMITESFNQTATYDVVCSFGTLEHFRGAKRRSAFQAQMRYLKPGGMVFFSVPNAASLFYRSAMWARKVAKVSPADPDEKPFSFRELRLAAQESGVKVCEIEGVWLIKDDFHYWILGTIKSGIRKVFRLRKPSSSLKPEDTSIDIDCLASLAKDNRTALDKRFSQSILFVGQKPVG